MVDSVTTTPPVKAPPAPKLSKAMQAVVDAQAYAKAHPSEVEKMSAARTTAKANAKKNNYFESEDYLRMKANEIKYRIDLYKNLGLQPEYEAAQQEGADVVAKYQALLKKASGSKTDTTA